MTFRNEHKWFKDVLGQMKWPAPSSDLHDRIMMQVSYPAAAVMSSFSAMKLSLWLLTAFVAAFGLGIVHNQAMSRSNELYANALYYGGSNLQLYQILES